MRDAYADSHGFPVTNRAILAIAIPMSLAYMTTPLLGVVNTGVVGRLGDPALIGGLAVGAVVIDFIFSCFNFLRSGTTGLVAQALGAGDEAEEQAAFLRAAVVALAAGVLLVLAAPLAVWAGGAFMGADPAVSAAMEAYVGVRMWGAPLILLNYAILGYALGRGEGRTGLGIQAALNGTNLILSLILGLSLGWGVAGVAWATVAGEAVAALVGLWIVRRRFARAKVKPDRARLRDKGAFRRMMSMNGDIMLRSFALLMVYAVFTRQGAQFGAETLAANALLMNLFVLMAFFADGFAMAAEQMGGRAYGARLKGLFLRTVRLTTLWAAAMAALAATVVMFYGDSLIAAMTTSESVRIIAYEHLAWAAFAGLSGVLAFQMDGVFIGASWSRDMRDSMAWSLAIFLAALWPLTEAFGDHGLWASLHVFFIARGLTLSARLKGRVASGFPALGLKGEGGGENPAAPEVGLKALWAPRRRDFGCVGMARQDSVRLTFQRARKLL